jgi:deoxyhypusine synthase
MGGIRDFLTRHYRHFNAAVVVEAAQAWVDLLDQGGKMMVTLGGAMSTAELGLSLAPLIRAGAVHAITCTGANLEEDLFNLVAHDDYKRIPNWRDLTPTDELALLAAKFNRVTDTCIPEEEAMRKIESRVLDRWRAADVNEQRFFPHEYLYQVLDEGIIQEDFQIDPQDSWLYAAWTNQLPLVVPGWEDSTLGNHFVSEVIMGHLSGHQMMRTGTEYMQSLAQWYYALRSQHPIGFFQIGGGIAGDFPICAVPMINQDILPGTPDWGPTGLWAYFCQISDAVTSYGGYSGAVPNEKITWGKLAKDTPRFMIQSDATIVAPLIFQYVLESVEL